MKCNNCDCTEVTFFHGVAYCELCRRMDCWTIGADTKPVSDKYLLIDYDSCDFISGTLEELVDHHGDDFGHDYGVSELLEVVDSNFKKVELEKHITWSVK